MYPYICAYAHMYVHIFIQIYIYISIVDIYSQAGWAIEYTDCISVEE